MPAKSEVKNPMDNFVYQNITISGLPGSGSTTLLKMLKESDELRFAGWKGFSGGEFMRAYALEMGLFQEEGGLHHDATHYDEDFDRKVDNGIREKVSNEQGWIIESWLSGFMAQGVPKTLKILMICSDMAVKVDRIVNRDGVKPKQALENMNNRYKNNLAKWQRMYHNEWQEWVVNRNILSATEPVDFWNPNLYDLVIDTYTENKEDVLKKVLNEIRKQQS